MSNNPKHDNDPRKAQEREEMPRDRERHGGVDRESDDLKRKREWPEEEGKQAPGKQQQR